MAAARMDCGIPQSRVSTDFLHNNSTSHTGPLSAIAELIDNAYDVDAKQLWIDKTQIKGDDCLTFMDDGNGLSRDSMHQMLSFGFSNKKALSGKLPIGMYGNGFKSGSMRLGRDAIVLSKSKNDLCVGMLSQTYLEKTETKDIGVPIISCNQQEADKGSEMDENRASLKDILKHSPFNTEGELLTELQGIESTTGTKIIIWKLRRTSEGEMELDFSTEDDIRILCDDLDTSVPEINSSLRAYCSILYLKPSSMQINIRGKKVDTHPITHRLKYKDETYTYKPNVVKNKIPIIFGKNDSKEHYGLMMYYKNRLIKPYLRVGCQKNAKNRISIGVVGVIECNYLEPTHNKQDFDNSNTYRKTISSVATKLREYSEPGKNPSAPIVESGDKTEDDEVKQLEKEKASLSLSFTSLTQEKQDLTAEIAELHSKVEDLEEENEQNKARLNEVDKWKGQMP